MSYTVVPAGGTGAAIVSLDATPPVRATAGQGGKMVIHQIDGFGIAPVNFPTTDFLPLVRIPTNAIVKNVSLLADSFPSTSLEVSIGLLFSDTNDGTPSIYQSVYKLTGATPSIVSQSFFAYNYSLSTSLPANGQVDLTYQNGVAGGNSVTDGFYVPSASQKPLWQALTAGGIGNLGKATSGAAPGAFASCQTDPGGFFDVTIFSTVTGVNTSAVNLGLRVTYIVMGN